MTELLNASALSARAKWLPDHDLRIIDYGDNRGWERHSLNTDRFLVANRSMTRFASGSTEEAAESAFASKYSIAWWKLAHWQEAMA